MPRESEDALYAYNDWKRDDELAAEEIREREAERKPDTATGTVQTAEKPLSDLLDEYIATGKRDHEKFMANPELRAIYERLEREAQNEKGMP